MKEKDEIKGLKEFIALNQIRTTDYKTRSELTKELDYKTLFSQFILNIKKTKNKEGIQALNGLITINNDRIAGYMTAMKVTSELDLKSLFTQFILTSQKCKLELELEVTILGGNVNNENKKNSRKLFRIWMSVITSLSGEDRKGILNSCNYGEDNTKNAYDMVIVFGFENLNKKQKKMIIVQVSLLKKDYDYVKFLQDVLLVA